MPRETPQEVLAGFIKMYLEEGERAAVEMASPRPEVNHNGKKDNTNH